MKRADRNFANARPASVSEKAFFAVARALFIGGILLAVVPLGAVQDGYFNLSLLVNGIVLGCACLVSWPNRDLARLIGWAAGLLAASTVYVIAQSVSFPLNPLAHPAWSEASERLGPLSGAISVAPAETLRAAPALALPFGVFMSALALHQDDAAALRLWKRLAWVGLAVAAYGLVQQFLLPRHLLSGVKTDESRSLTAVFVNRNNTAAFLSLAGLMLLGRSATAYLSVSEDRCRGEGSGLPSLAQPGLLRLAAAVLSYGISAVALLLTFSRSGSLLGITCQAVALAWLLAAYSKLARRPLGVAAIGGAGVALLASAWFLMPRTLERIQIQGAEDARWCTFASVLQAIKDHPIAGTGFGAFESAFRPYRNSECGIAGLWDKAHNSFLEAYLGLGAPSLLLLLVACVVLLRTFGRGLANRERMKFAPVIGLCAMGFIALQSVVEFPTQIPGVAAYFAACLGVCASLSLSRSKKQKTRRDAQRGDHPSPG